MFDLDTFNSVLFNDDSGVLYAICSNLIYNIEDKECLRNAKIVTDYYRLHGKLPQLFWWAFRRQIMINDKGELLFSDDGFFTTFFYSFCKTFFNEFYSQVIEFMASQESLFDQIDIDILTTYSSDISDENLKKYNQSLCNLSTIIKKGLDFRNSVNASFPPILISVLKTIFEKVNTLVQDSENIICLRLFNTMVRNGFTRLIKDRDFLDIIFKEKPSLKNYEKKIAFIVNLTPRIFCDKSEDSDYIAKQLTNSLKGADVDNRELYSNLMKLVDVKDDFKTPKDDVITEMIVLMKTNSLPMKKDVPSDVVFKLYQALEFERSNIDDYLVYEKLIGTFQHFVHDYYVSLYKMLARSDNYEDQFYSLRQQVVLANIELREKRLKNENLKTCLRQAALKGKDFSFSTDVVLDPVVPSPRKSQKKKHSLSQSFESFEKKQNDTLDKLKEIHKQRLETFKKKKDQVKSEWKSNWKVCKESIKNEANEIKEKKKRAKDEKREKKERKKLKNKETTEKDTSTVSSNSDEVTFSV
ncbi:hypothetical protein EIN_169380 [Entamoeba invadens IP1]|uniref:Uncharacterized protein n=1 Tax=Entamoeba invadens IP1 TaxID=370355 RepID=A0A0A1U0U0_ENTIV|nr:hypothetical protein EIN_169380 [Entamoeba invadens IP1]ELP84503.1 hypothetical protein EIN_169380 [Entamoeba invadens IP1]|eukprot:XP_004183849.1 hypothetical protein EIN_169380 [Entamoeba invadens IP1]